jgi:hypothetical protein
MAKIYLSYRYGGEDLSELEVVLNKIKNTLELNGHDVFCSIYLESLFNAKDYSKNQIYDMCLKEQEKRKVFVALVKSNEKSIGMMKEFRNAIKLKQKYILVIKKGLKFVEFRKHADIIIEYESYDHLCDTLKKLKL